MDIRNRHFPYPVLSNFSDDYTDTGFIAETKLEKEVNDIIFLFTSILDNQELIDLIEEDKVEYVYHLECSHTSFRKIIKTTMTEKEYRVPEHKINDKLTVCSFIVAKKNLFNYQNEDFHEDYGNASFNIERGSILAIGGQTDFRITKETEELYKIPSIFSILRSDTDENSGMRVELNQDKIGIYLCNEDFSYYQIMAMRPDIEPAIHGMIILPALIFIFESIKSNENGIEEFEDYRWFKALDGTLRRGNLELSVEAIETKGSFTLAQQLLGLPINRAFKGLMNIGEGEDGE